MARPSTFSIAAVDTSTGEAGVAVASKFLAVGAAVPWAKANAGAIATQSWVNLGYGPDGLRLLEEGLPADEVVRRLTAADAGREQRQLGIVDRHGNSAAWTGKECFEWAGYRLGPGYAIQGNILAGESVISSMEAAFLSVTGPLVQRLMASLEAGQQAGGDRRGQQAAAIYVAKEKGNYGGFIDRYIDLRVDDHPAPIDELRKLLTLHFLYFGETDINKLVPMSEAITRETQSILARLGFYSGPTHGAYDEATRNAFRQFCLIENLEERWREGDAVDGEILNFMRSRFV
jgi:uncharacterized Ntn-hydrolase superfamily protein